MPAAEPLQDDRLTLVTTTESKAWQLGAISISPSLSDRYAML
jgi:hypothetical protein